ncbi:serine protease, HtrA/DegQ/DegS family [Microscilla marina ATCC 23134]|uniref:Serine protease, HtrA/DegQ/DegS family n=1 Tax=Microscilla marina ATCC 23134 TaxID=313606 RepID=A1ZJ15_MICM2|nr:serine protease, HtrA/DegQ/DegS family [Microscilla marina ATCC 23134]
MASGVTLGVYKLAGFDRSEIVLQEAGNGENGAVVRFAKGGNAGTPVDFTLAASMSTPMVVHIVATQKTNQRASRGRQVPDIFREFFGEGGGGSFRRRNQPSRSSGSGVIVSKDGYIVTNNHVIDNAREVDVILNNKKTYKATVIGTDPSTDLALVKINAKNLPSIVLGNSDNVKVGQWVLAVGNPFNLESTVTAGIVSAKGRNLNMLQRGQRGRISPIESFIQTDAAVNPGNSGGALINTKGELIGINTAIATPTGTFAGYSFAVPVNIVKKIIKDLVEFGTVQRAYLGVYFRELNGELAKQLKLDITEGTHIDSLVVGGSAEQSGVKKGDVIVDIEGKKIKGSSDLLEAIGRKRPGDKVRIKVSRNGKIKEVTIKLKNRDGNSDLVTKKKATSFRTLGAEFAELTDAEKQRYDISGGVKVSKMFAGTLRSMTDMQEGFIITEVNGKKVSSISDLKSALSSSNSSMVTLGGVYPNDPGQRYYAFKNK